MGENHFRDWLIVIPARMASTRLKEKPLQDLCGKPLIIRVAENLLPLTKKGAEVLVACDDPKILEICQKNNVSAVLTATSHESGTDRCFEASQSSSRRFVLNVQGDEPFIGTQDLEQLMNSFAAQADDNSLATLIHNSDSQSDFENPNVCKVAVAKDKRALYFSRAPIPFARDQDSKQRKFWHHVGVYGFTTASMKRFCSFSPSPLEKTERLEQLRALEHGMTIMTFPCQSLPLGIDTEADMERARAKFNQ